MANYEVGQLLEFIKDDQSYHDVQVVKVQRCSVLGRVYTVLFMAEGKELPRVRAERLRPIPPQDDEDINFGVHNLINYRQKSWWKKASVESVLSNGFKIKENGKTSFFCQRKNLRLHRDFVQNQWILPAAIQ